MQEVCLSTIAAGYHQGMFYITACGTGTTSGKYK